MDVHSEAKQIIVTPQVFVSLAPGLMKGGDRSSGPCHADIGVAWAWDETNIRMDITLPQAGALNIIFPLVVDTVYINGVIVWDNKGQHIAQTGGNTVEPVNGGLTLNFATGGAYHILAHGLAEDPNG